MGNTVFYQEAQKERSKITWWSILSESFRKHSMKDLEYALAAGTPFDTARPDTMLKKWHKPWVWTRVLLLLCAVAFGFWGLMKLIGINGNLVWDTLIIFASITPIASMVLFWELNVARDISFFKLIGCFLIGALFSLSFTLLLGEIGINEAALDFTNTDPDGLWYAWIAPITEEPAKLLAGLLILMALAKAGTNIFGCTGIAIGAGVGTGFTLFETIGYVFNNAVSSALSGEGTYAEILKYGLEVVRVRSIPGLNGHMLMCVPYIAMIALVYHETHDWGKSIFNRKTILAFVAACILHGWWDVSDGVAYLFLNMVNVIKPFETEAAMYTVYNGAVVVQTWLITALYLLTNILAIRLCLRQAVREGDYVSGQGMALGELTHAHFDAGVHPQAAANVLNLVSVGTVLPGQTWQCGSTVLIGKLNDCAVRFPADTAGLSRVHCRLKNCGSYWTICDMGSSYGTAVNGAKLEANKEYKLPAGSVLQLGSAKVKLQIR